MQALILAAGSGSRLGQITRGRPKCLLEVGRRPIIDHQLEILAEAGIGPVAMVVGYCADEIREVVGIGAEYIENTRWNTTNSLYSFNLARKWVRGGLLILNCDLVLHPEIINRLIAAGSDAIAYDSSSGNGREHMKVRVLDGQVIDMSKDLPVQDTVGENVGALYFTSSTVEALFNKADALLAAGREKEWLGSAVREIIRERKVQAVDIAGLPWAEIDFPYDLDRARREVWPAICQNAHKPKPLWKKVCLMAALPLILILPYFLTGLYNPQQPATWVSAEAPGATRMSITNGERTRSWWRLERGQEISVTVEGPGTARIDSRLILDDNTNESVPYVLDIHLDGHRLDWFKEKTSPSKSWKDSGLVVSERSRTEVDIPPGTHSLRISFVAPDEGRSAIVQVRYLEQPEPD